MLITQKLKQNKKILALSAVLILLAFISVVPAFASSDLSSSEVPLISSLSNSTGPDGLKICGYSDSMYGYTGFYYARKTAGSSPVYAGIVLSGNQGWHVAFASESSFTISRYRIISSSGNVGLDSSASSSLDNLYNSGLYMFAGTSLNWSGHTEDYYIPSYSSDSDFVLAVRDFIDNPPLPPVSGYSLDYSLPAGNVIYIDITNHSEEISLSQTTPISYWSYTSTQYSGVVSSLPSSSGFALPIAGTSVISWSGSGKSDSFGKYSSWVSSQVVSGQTSDHGHAYFVVVNPLANNVASSNGTSVDSVANSYINISVPYANSYKVYPLKESFNAGVYDNENPEGTNNGTGTPDGEGGWTQSGDDGEPWSPEYGGLTSAESNESTIHDFLQRISQDISGFFGGAIGAVKTLVAAGSDFFNVLVGLYSWLPPTVLSVLSSALILVITIGVVKVFI